MAEGAYSQRFRRLQKEHMDQFRKARQDENEDLNLRSQRLHLETARRCRSMALKKKQHAQREERLRQAILERRRQEMQEVTNKFQRMGRRPSLTTAGDIPTRSGGTPTLDEALQMVLGNSRPISAVGPPVAAESGSARPKRPISATFPSHGLKFDSSLTEDFHNGTSPTVAGHGTLASPSAHSGRHLPYQRVDRTPSINGAWKPGSSPATTMREDSLQSLASSRGLFEQRLSEHQRTLATQQQAALQELGDAIYGNGNGGTVFSHSSGNFHGLSRVQDINGNTAPNSELVVDSRSAIADTPLGMDSVSKNDTSLPFPNDGLHSFPGSSIPDSAQLRPAVLERSSGSDTYRTDHANVAAVRSGNANRGPSSDVNIDSPSTVAPNARLPDRSTTADVFSTLAVSAASAHIAAPSFFLHRSGSSSPVVAVVQPSVHPPVSGISAAHMAAPFGQKAPVDEGSSTAAENHARTETHKVSVEGYGDQSEYAALAGVYSRPPGGFAVQRSSLTTSVVHHVAVPVAPESTASRERVPAAPSAAKPPTGRPTQDDKLDTKPPRMPFDVSKPTGVESNQLAGFLIKSSPADQSKPGVSPVERPSNIPVARYREPVSLKDINCIDDIPIDDSSSVSSLVSDTIPVRPCPLVEPSGVKPLPKGILKKRPSSVPISSHTAAAVSSQRLGSGGLARLGSTASSDSTSLRDSLEVTKSHLQFSRPLLNHQTTAELKSAKKSVRFAENLCEEAPAESKILPAAQNDSLSENLLFYPTPPAQQKPKEPISVSWRSARPLSAKVVSSTPVVDPRIKVPRVASAGALRRTSFTRPGQPYTSTSNFTPHHQTSDNAGDFVQPVGTTVVALSAAPPGEPPGNYNVRPRSAGPTAESGQGIANNKTAEVTPTSGVTNSQTMINGVAVDRTPTNEEIDWLWQKVRSCLSNSRSSTMTPAATPITRPVGEPDHVTSVASRAAQRQPDVVASQPSAGSQLSVNVRPHNASTVNGGAAASLRQARSSTYVNNYMGSGLTARPKQPRNVVTMETLSGLARPPVVAVPGVVGANEVGFNDVQSAATTNAASNSRLLTQRRVLQQLAFPASSTAVHESSTVFGRQASAPTSGRVGQENRLQQSISGVTESLAGFLAAEKLCQTDLTESAVGRTLSAAEQTRHFNSNVVPSRGVAPSALSIEEHRVLQSLERLDDRLKANEIAVSNISSGIIPRPPAFSAGFRGQQLRSGLQRRPVTYNGSVPRQYFQQQGTTTTSMAAHNGFIGQQQSIR